VIVNSTVIAKDLRPNLVECPAYGHASWVAPFVVDFAGPSACLSSTHR